VLSAGNVVYYGGADRTARAFNLASQKTLWKKGVRQPVDTPMALADGTLLVKSDAGKLLALSTDRGRLAWSYDASDAAVNAPATDGRHVFVATRDGTLTALDARDGHTVWQARLGAGITTAPLATRGRLYAGTHDGALFVLDAATGTRVRRTLLAGAPAATPVDAGSRVIVTIANGMVQAFEK
jgi:outer membrane protein assembly factor BamB